MGDNLSEKMCGCINDSMGEFGVFHVGIHLDNFNLLPELASEFLDK